MFIHTHIPCKCSGELPINDQAVSWISTISRSCMAKRTARQRVWQWRRVVFFGLVEREWYGVVWVSKEPWKKLDFERYLRQNITVVVLVTTFDTEHLRENDMTLEEEFPFGNKLLGDLNFGDRIQFAHMTLRHGIGNLVASSTVIPHLRNTYLLSLEAITRLAWL